MPAPRRCHMSSFDPEHWMAKINSGVPVPVSANFSSPLHGVVADHTRFPSLAAIRNVVSVVVRKRAAAALAVVDDVVTIAIGGPFEE